MKKFFLIICLITTSVMCFAQGEASDFTGNTSDHPRDPRSDMMNFVPNEVLVKFKDDVVVSSGTTLKSAGISSVDQLLRANRVASLEKLFPTEIKLKSARIVKDPQGRDMKIPSLHNIYKITVPQLKSTGSAPADIFKFIEEMKALPEVEYAEPNYICSIDDLKPVGPILTSEDVAKLQNKNLKSDQVGVVPNDPLYSQQGYIQTVKADQVWAQTTGDSSQVIAIVDTGVDWNHPDLKNKIWKNKLEIPDNGLDDDGNGFRDDIRGWDFINNDNNPMDDNSHGTHVAGIAAAESNNGIGIAGISWKAKIMPVKVFPASGGTDVSTVVKGINYASNNGATVINMSFSTYGRSITLDNVLKDAFSKNILLVAAAGNDAFSIYYLTDIGLPKTAYPAALPYVFGVQSDGGYSNYDPDGPIFSEDVEGLNYELKAPGDAFSTVPNGNYRELIGTSMAAPIISGALALYRSYFPDKTIEELWSDFIHSSDGIIDLNKVFFNSNKKSSLDLLSFTVNDVNAGSDKDGKADAGEIVDVVVQIRNTGTPVKGVYAKIKHVDGDPRDITILKDSVFFGSIGVYRSLKNEMMPFKVQINKDCYNNRTVFLEVSMCDSLEHIIFTQKLNFKIFNGEELSGILLRDTTFTADKNWVISNSLRISQGVTVTINPGASVEVLAGVDNRGSVIAIGTPESRISVKGAIGENAIYKYVDFDLNGGNLSTTDIDNCTISNVNSLTTNKLINSKIINVGTGINCNDIYRCYIENSILASSRFNYAKIYESVFDNFVISDALIESNGFKLSNNIFKDVINYNFKYNPNYYNIIKNKGYLISTYDGSQFRIVKNTFLNNGTGTFFIRTSGSDDMVTLSNQYWGTTNGDKIKLKYYDFTEDAGRPYFNYLPTLIAPSDSCPGHVWKVLVNGKDTQDDPADPVGVGKQRFDVYFNREMNKSVTPRVTFGGLYPYLSNNINEEWTWSSDGRIFTAYKTIKLTTGDGINRIRVSGARQATDWGWEIPVEDQRFGFIINAANSASMDFMATPSLGKVKLEWNNNSLADGLGFNMYRMEHINDSVLTKPILVNSTLITDTLFTDFSVTPNKKYYYYYKILRTNLSETDSSKVVSATPFTASKGDANGDLAVNVLDITTIVAYLLNNNPQPFITEAADLNSDGNINVLDIVGVVNLVLGNKSATIATTQQVHLYMQNDTLFADAPVAIGGIQFDISGATSVEEIQKLKALEGFESGYSTNEIGVRLLYYSLSGKSIPLGTRIPLLKLKKGSGVVDAIFADKIGTSIPVNYDVTGVWNLSDKLNGAVAELGQNFPNPLNLHTTIPIRINEPVDEAVIRIVNMYGQTIEAIHLNHPTVGEHMVQWNSGANKGFFAYLLEIRRGKQHFICPVRKMVVQ